MPLLVQHLKYADFYLSTASPEQLRQIEASCLDFLEHVKSLKNATHFRKRAVSTEARKSLDPVPHEPKPEIRSNPFSPVKAESKKPSPKQSGSPVSMVKVKMQLRVGSSDRKSVFFPYNIWLDGKKLFWQALGDDIIKSDTLRSVDLANPQRHLMRLEVGDEEKTIIFADSQSYLEWGNRCLAAVS
mmetsp:Transcript_692/g.1268  ORF Transcript_692/g.1268 Transcript_692/m.1268 type:complete len:186 (+) Transcript_692:6196-6753(+)